MSFFLRWLTLPARAPMLILLALISVYLGAHWGLLQEDIRSSVADQSLVDEAYWVLSLSQVVIVVSFCTLPELVLRQISLFMAASKALTLVVTLLVVVVGGMYLLYMPGFADLLVLTAALLGTPRSGAIACLAAGLARPDWLQRLHLVVHDLRPLHSPPIGWHGMVSVVGQPVAEQGIGPAIAQHFFHVDPGFGVGNGFHPKFGDGV